MEDQAKSAPTPDELEAYRSGSLSTNDAGRVREALERYPDAAELLLDLQTAAMGSDPDVDELKVERALKAVKARAAKERLRRTILPAAAALVLLSAGTYALRNLQRQGTAPVLRPTIEPVERLELLPGPRLGDMTPTVFGRESLLVLLLENRESAGERFRVLLVRSDRPQEILSEVIGVTASMDGELEVRFRDGALEPADYRLIVYPQEATTPVASYDFTFRPG